jgi:hypothetical protein
MRLKILLLFLAMLCFMFASTAVILAFGMMPTIASFFTDRSVGKNRTICVGCMNFAGCFPFPLEFWTEFGHQTMRDALDLITDSHTVIIIYVLAAGGYAIDIAISGIASGIIVERSKLRLKKIKNGKDKMTERWGKKVTGEKPLDDFGFPIEK